MRTPFQRDRDRIVHSKPFRRLKGKTQVFIDPQGDHYRTRMTHTLETTAISRVVARALRLNEDLTEAIGLGHDMGHTPFGHAGEDALDTALGGHFGPTRVPPPRALVPDRARAEPDLRGLRGHPHAHRRAASPTTLEGKIVRIVDRVAYINHDIDDAVRYGLLDEGDLPREEIELLGPTGAQADRPARPRPRRDSAAAGDIRQSEEIGGAMHRLRDFMFERVYLADQAHEEHRRAHETIEQHRRPPRRRAATAPTRSSTTSPG